MYGTHVMKAAHDAASIRIDIHDKIMDLILNRPAKKNALTDEMYLALVAGLQKARGEEDVHVIVLRGEGDCFCAGNDLQAFRNRGPASGPSPGRLFLETLAAVEKPVIAAVKGPAGDGPRPFFWCPFCWPTILPS